MTTFYTIGQEPWTSDLSNQEQSSLFVSEDDPLCTSSYESKQSREITRSVTFKDPPRSDPDKSDVIPGLDW